MISGVLGFVVVLGFLACDSGNAEPVPLLPTQQITVEGNGVSEKLTVELARTSAEQQKGLMYRQRLPEDRGMLFLFDADRPGGFWMKNTYIPLDIAYLAADGTVQEIVAAKPLDETILTPAEAYRMVLEVNQGWFERHGLGVGSRVLIDP
jgi:uncharacterized membrane protein (UPF0127 family)